MPTSTNRSVTARISGAAPAVDAAWLRARIDAGRGPRRMRPPGRSIHATAARTRSAPAHPGTSDTAAPFAGRAAIAARRGRTTPLRRQLRDLGIAAVLAVAFLHPLVPAALSAVTGYLDGPATP